MKLFSIFSATALGGSGSLLKFAFNGGVRQSSAAASPSSAKRVVVVLLAMLLLGSIGSMAQSPPPPITAATALTNVANAVEDGRRVETPAFAVEDLISRIAALEQRVSEQDDALRRVISTMIDWMDKEGNVEARLAQKSRAA